jgi:ATP-dependent Clp protease ATP-binding subunit ClpC
MLHNPAGKGALDNFCVDITARAADGKIDPVIGRTKEVQRVVEILARRTKNNPILLGEPGVGKTAIAEGLALRIVKNDVPEFLQVSDLSSSMIIFRASLSG